MSTVSTKDLTAICLKLDPCVCQTCGHGHHEDCSGTHLLFSGELTACRCLCRKGMTGCQACGVGPEDECETGCPGEPALSDEQAPSHPLPLIEVLTPDLIEGLLGADAGPPLNPPGTNEGGYLRRWLRRQIQSH